MMLRDPADRLFAHYAAARASESARGSFADWIEQQRRAEDTRSADGGPAWGAIRAGNYHTHLARFREHFPDAQLHVSYYEDFTADPDAVLSDIFAFLGVDGRVRVDRTVRHNVTTTPKWPALSALRRPVSALLKRLLPRDAYERARSLSRQPFGLAPQTGDRIRAIALYRNEIEALSSAVGRDLSRWLEP
jgi:hypothetical protein